MKNRNVVIASDFSGYNLKEAVRQCLLAEGYEVTDVGQTEPDDRVLYYDAAAALAKAMQSKAYERGIVICGTGGGVSLIANKFKGVYCIPCECIYTAERIQVFNNANVLAMGDKVISQEMGCEMAKTWLRAKWCEGFSEERAKIHKDGFAFLQKLEAE